MSMRGVDSASITCVGARFSAVMVGGCGIAGMGVRRESRGIHAAVRGVSPTALCRRGAEISGDDLPVVAVQAGGWQVQHDAPHRRVYPGAEFQEVFAQGADLGGSEGGARGAQTQFLVEHVGGGAQQTPQLIGEEAAATGAVDLKAVMQLLDPIFDVTAGAVDRFIQMPGRLPEVGDHEARVVLRLAPWMAHDFGLDDHAPALLPSAGGVAALAVDMCSLARFARPTPGGAHQARGPTLKNLVFAHRDDVFESLALEESEDRSGCEAAIEAHPQPCAREGLSQPR